MGALPSFRATELRRRERYPNLVGAWSFDEASGTIAADSTGSQAMALGLGATMHLTVGAGMTWAAGRSSGTSLQNAGVSATASVNVNISASSMTMMGWARPLDLTTGSSRPLFGIWDAANTSGSTFVAIWAQRGDGFGTPNVLQGNVRAGGVLNPINGPSALTVNTWTHLALSYDGANMRLYQDGVEVASAVQSGAAYTGAAVFNVAPSPANAQIDDVRIFSTALTQAQIQSFMQESVAIP